MKKLRFIFVVLLLLSVTGCVLSTEDKELKEDYESQAPSVLKECLKKKYSIDVDIIQVDSRTYLSDFLSNSELLDIVDIKFSYNGEIYTGIINFNDNSCYDNYQSKVIAQNMEKYLETKYNLDNDESLIYIDWGYYNSYKFTNIYNNVSAKYNNNIEDFLDTINKIVIATDGDVNSYKDILINIYKDLDVQVYAVAYENKDVLTKNFNIDMINNFISCTEYDVNDKNCGFFNINTDVYKVFPIKNLAYVTNDFEMEYSYNYNSYNYVKLSNGLTMVTYSSDLLYTLTNNLVILECKYDSCRVDFLTDNRQFNLIKNNEKLEFSIVSKDLYKYTDYLRRDTTNNYYFGN